MSLTSRGYDSDGMQHVLEPDRMTASTQSMPGSVVEPLAMSIARRLPHQLQQQQVPPEAVEFAGVTSMSPGAGRARDKIYDAILQQNFRLLADQGGQHEHRSQLCSETAAVEAFDPAAAIYCSGLAPDQAQVLGQAVSSSGTPARAGSCVTGPIEGTPTSLPNGMTSTQVSSAEESTIRYQSQALTAASLSQPGVAHGSLAAFSLQTELPGNISNQASSLGSQIGDLGQYKNLSFDLSITSESIMGGGSVYPQPERQQPLLGNATSPPQTEQITAAQAAATCKIAAGHLSAVAETTSCESRQSDAALYGQQPSRALYPDQLKMEPLADDVDYTDYALVKQCSVAPVSQSLDNEDRTHKAKKQRSAFDDTRRKETADTRWRKACLRCRVQKVRVSAVVGLGLRKA